MPTCLFEAYVDQVDVVVSERLVSMADAALYAQLTPESGRRWREALVRRITPISRAVDSLPSRGSLRVEGAEPRGRGVPHHRSSLFFWQGAALSPAALKDKLAGQLRSGFSRD